MSTTISLRKVRDFGDNINATFRFIGQNFKGLYGAIIRTTGLFMLVQIAAFIVIGRQFTSGNLLDSFGDFNPAQGAVFFIMLFVLIITSIIFYVLYQGVVYEYMLQYDEKGKENVKTSEVARATFQKFWTDLASNLAFIGGMLAILLPFGLLAIFFVAAFEEVGAVFIVLMFFALIPIFLYLSVRWYFIIIARHEDANLSVLDGFKRSAKMVKGYWWPTFGLIFVIGIIQGFASNLITIPVQLVMTFLATSGMQTSGYQEDNLTYMLLAVIVPLGLQFFVSYFFQVLQMVAIGLQYFNLVERKEGKDLIAKIEEVAPNDTTGQSNDLYEDDAI